MDLFQTLILAIIEGITEYLPISSTGHMVIASTLMGIEDNPFVKNFEIIIQFGAIIAVLVLYGKKFINNKAIVSKVILAFIPTGLIGFLLKSKVDFFLGQVQIVAWSSILGGVILIWCDSFFARRNNQKEISQLSIKDCLYLGLYQSLAIVPGVSRSGASIVGGLFLGMKQKEAAEFSFFLAVPTLFAASAYKTFKMIRTGNGPQPEEWYLLGIGMAVAFIVAALAIKTFIGILQKFGFKFFGYYRIVLGAIILFLT